MKRSRRIALIAAATRGAPIPPGSQTLTITLVNATWDVSITAFRAGESGSNYFGAFVAIPSATFGDHAFYFTHASRGWDPQPYNDLAGYTMHAVNIAAGAQTASAVATALRAALAAVYGAAGGTGADAEVTGLINAAGAFLGSSSPGARGAWGCREDTPAFDANPMENALHAFSEFAAGADGLATGLATRLRDAAGDVRMGLYVDGTAASGVGGLVNPDPDLNDTLLLCQAQITASGTGWVCEPLAPAEVEEIPENTPIQYVVKSEGAQANGSFTTMGVVSASDLEQQQLAVIATSSIDPDPAVAYPSTLEGVTLDASFAVVAMVAFEYRTRPHRGDAGGITLAAS